MLSNLNIEDVRSVYLSLPIAACLINRDKSFIAANEKYAEMMQKPLGVIIGGNMADITLQTHIENASRDFQIFDAGGHVPDHEIRLGDDILLVSVNPFSRSGESHVSAISVTLQNITARKKMEMDLRIAHRGLLQAKRQIEELVHTDALTNLPNRRSFDACIKREIGLSRRHQTPLALVMADIDVFKSYNDLYGHVAGDSCLAAVAQVIAAGLKRPGDLAARYGGEEFVIVLPHTPVSSAMELTQKIRQAIQSRGITHEGNATGVVTASFGVAGLPGVPADMDTQTARRVLLKAADNALYQAKAAGRNRVVEGHISPSPSYVQDTNIPR